MLVDKLEHESLRDEQRGCSLSTAQTLSDAPWGTRMLAVE